MRKTYEEIKELCKKYNVDRLWSWSRYNKYKSSQFEYYLHYITKLKADRENSIYGASGGFAHDIMERFYNKEIKYDDMIKEFEDMWVTLNIAELKFDRCNEDKNKTISDKYYYDLQHFFTHHEPIKSKIDLERFIIIKVGKYVFQGYIDATYKDSDGNFVIQDFKTSSIYKGQKALDESGQLVLYSEGLIQLGVPIEKIKICWQFLKYSSVTTQLANGKTNVRQIERCKIGESLKSNAKMWLKKCGFEDEIDSYLDLLVQTNDISCLPEEVQEKYEFDDCYVYVDLTQDMVNNLKSDIEETIDEILRREEEFKTTKDEKLFWDDEESLKKQSYYFANLCGWSAKLHKPYGQYLDSLEKNKGSNGDIFNGVGSTISDTDDDLAWLNSL